MTRRRGVVSVGVDGAGGGDLILGGGADDLLGGGAGDDYIEGQDGNDAIDGGGGGNDIAAGAGGDVLDLRGLVGHQAGTNPFAGGHLRIVDDGFGSARLEVSRDAAGTDWQRLLVLQSVAAGDLRAANYLFA